MPAVAWDVGEAGRAGRGEAERELLPASCARARGPLRPLRALCFSSLSLTCLSLSSVPSLPSDMSTYHELVKKAAGPYREMFVV